MVQSLGVLGNALVIFVIARERRLKSNYYYLVLNLAVCDLVLLISLTIKYAIFPWFADDNTSSLNADCKFVQPLKQYVYNCEVYLMVAIGALRHRAIVHPFKQPLTRTQVKGILIVGHVAAFLLQAPYTFSYESQKGKTECTIAWKERFPAVFKAYDLIQIFLRFVIPILVLTFVYMKMSRALLLHHRLMISTIDNQKVVNARLANAKQIRNTKATIIGVLVVALFCIGKIPPYIIQELNTYGIHVHSIHSFWTILWWVVCTSTVNPLIYGFADQTLRMAFMRTVKGVVN